MFKVVKSHWKHWQNMQKLNNVFDIRKEYCLYIQNMRNTLGRDIWAQIGRGKSGQAGETASGPLQATPGLLE